MLEKSERAQLLEVARCSIASGLGGAGPERMPDGARSARLLEPRATFTTLTLQGKLRGCCGTIEPRRALVDDVWHNAWVSAFADPRFRPIAARELGALEISRSSRSPPAVKPSSLRPCNRALTVS
jgi:AMMECR1 domain-containing protein